MSASLGVQHLYARCVSFPAAVMWGIGHVMEPTAHTQSFTQVTAPHLSARFSTVTPSKAVQLCMYASSAHSISCAKRRCSQPGTECASKLATLQQHSDRPMGRSSSSCTLPAHSSWPAQGARGPCCLAVLGYGAMRAADGCERQPSPLGAPCCLAQAGCCPPWGTWGTIPGVPCRACITQLLAAPGCSLFMHTASSLAWVLIVHHGCLGALHAEQAPTGPAAGAPGLALPDAWRMSSVTAIACGRPEP